MMSDSEIKIIPTRFQVSVDGVVIGICGQAGQDWVFVHKDGSFTYAASPALAIARKLAKSNVDYRSSGDK